MYSNIVHSELEKEKDLMGEFIGSVRAANYKQEEALI